MQAQAEVAQAKAKADAEQAEATMWGKVISFFQSRPGLGAQVRGDERGYDTRERKGAPSKFQVPKSETLRERKGAPSKFQVPKSETLTSG